MKLIKILQSSSRPTKELIKNEPGRADIPGQSQILPEKNCPPGASENRRPDVFLGLRQQSARSIGMEIHAGNQHQLRLASVKWEKMGTRGRTGVLSVRNLFTQAAIRRQVRALASRGLPYARSAPVPGRSNATCPAARKFSTVHRRRELKTNKT